MPDQDAYEAFRRQMADSDVSLCFRSVEDQGAGKRRGKRVAVAVTADKAGKRQSAYLVPIPVLPGKRCQNALLPLGARRLCS